MNIYRAKNRQGRCSHPDLKIDKVDVDTQISNTGKVDVDIQSKKTGKVKQADHKHVPHNTHTDLNNVVDTPHQGAGVEHWAICADKASSATKTYGATRQIHLNTRQQKLTALPDKSI